MPIKRRPALLTTRFQVPTTKNVDRGDHVWFLKYIEGGNGRTQFKCCLCGALTENPPPYPTPENWVPNEHELPLTDQERKLCPNPEISLL